MLPIISEVRTSYVDPTSGKVSYAARQVSSINWAGWLGRPVATMDTPKDAVIDAYLRVSTGSGANANQQTELARLPLPSSEWITGIATVRAQDASAGILLPRAKIAAGHRTASLHVEVAPMGDCAGLNLRWERPAAVVVRALTGEPYEQWKLTGPSVPQSPAAPPPPVDSASSQTIFVGASGTSTFTEFSFTQQGTGTPPVTVTLAADTGAVACAAPNQDRNCRHVAIAVPTSVAITGTMRPGAIDQEWCSLVIADCTITTEITIGTPAYKFVSAGPFFTLQDLEMRISWSDNRS